MRALIGLTRHEMRTAARFFWQGEEMDARRDSMKDVVFGEGGKLDAVVDFRER